MVTGEVVSSEMAICSDGDEGGDDGDNAVTEEDVSSQVVTGEAALCFLLN